MDQRNYVQYGCGMCAPDEWINFDSSPTLRIQKLPVLGEILKNRLNTIFPPNVRYGDIVKGLPVEEDSCQGLFCSHTLEHLSLVDFRRALSNSFSILKPGGIFRILVPDLEKYSRRYLDALDMGIQSASIQFMNETLLGMNERPRKAKDHISSIFGNSHHLWMWDYHSLSKELADVGFSHVRNCSFSDCEDKMFRYVEERGRFTDAVAIECRKV
jgi:hypothetical protein